MVNVKNGWVTVTSVNLGNVLTLHQSRIVGIYNFPSEQIRFFLFEDEGEGEGSGKRRISRHPLEQDEYDQLLTGLGAV